MIEEKEIEVDGETYRLLPWDYKVGRRWLYKLVAAAVAAGGSSGTELGAAAAVLGNLSEDDVDSLIETCEKYTLLVRRGDDGKEKPTPLAKVSALHMRRRYFAMVAIAKEHVIAEFGDFFARVPELVGDAVRAKASGK